MFFFYRIRWKKHHVQQIHKCLSSNSYFQSDFDIEEEEHQTRKTSASVLPATPLPPLEKIRRFHSRTVWPYLFKSKNSAVSDTFFSSSGYGFGVLQAAKKKHARNREKYRNIKQISSLVNGLKSSADDGDKNGTRDITDLFTFCEPYNFIRPQILRKKTGKLIPTMGRNKWVPSSWRLKKQMWERDLGKKPFWFLARKSVTAAAAPSQIFLIISYSFFSYILIDSLSLSLLIQYSLYSSFPREKTLTTDGV